jgi:hypothetical protein
MRRQFATFLGVIVSLSLLQSAGAQQIHSAPGRRTSSWVHGDTTFISAHPGTLLRFIQRGDTVWMMREERGKQSPEIRWLICGDSAVAEAPRRVVRSDLLLLPRQQALQQMHADSILAKLHSP